MTDKHEIVKAIKQSFFALRNGIVADTLRNSGDTHKLILGVNIQQLQSMTSVFEADALVAEELWQNMQARECRLFAPMIYPRDEFPYAKALAWIETVENIEIADNLCHKLLRYQDYAERLGVECTKSECEMSRYVGFRLLLNLLVLGKVSNVSVVKALADDEVERNQSMTKALAVRVLEDCAEAEMN